MTFRKKYRFSSFHAETESISLDDKFEVALATWDELDAFIIGDRKLQPDAISPSTTIDTFYSRSDGATTQLAKRLSAKFGLKISPPAVKKCKTFGELSTLISQLRLHNP